MSHTAQVSFAQQSTQSKLLDILFLGLLILYALAGRNAVPFHGDESTFLAMSRDYHELFYEHDWDWFAYRGLSLSKYDHYRLIRLTAGPVSWLTIGLAWDLAGMTVSDLNGFWGWAADPSGDSTTYDANVARGNMPNERLLLIARTPSSLFLALSVVIVFRIGWRLTHSRLAAYGASLIYVTTPAVLVNGQRAMQEGAMLCTTGFTVLLALRAIEAQQAQARQNSVPIGWYAGLGVAGGLALASKHSSFLVIAPSLLAVLFAPLLHRGAPRDGGTQFDWRHICAATGSGVVVLLVFYLLMPAWWSWARLAVLTGLAGFLLSLGWEQNKWLVRVLRGLAVLSVAGVALLCPNVSSELMELPRTVIGLRLAIIAAQARSVGALHGIEQRLVFLLKQALLAQPQYFEVSAWGEIRPIAAQIANYERAGLAGRGGGPVWAGVLSTLLAAGIWALAIRRFEGRIFLVVVWLSLPAIALLASNTVPWQRYYLVLKQPLAVFCGLGLWRIHRVVIEMRKTARG